MPHVATLLCAVLLVVVPARAHAHGDLHQQIARVTAQLRKQPNNAVLLHKRGELHRAHTEYRAAFADYARAAQLDPKLVVVRLSRGRALLETKRYAEAHEELSRFLQAEPQHAEALLLRARAHAALRRHDDAEADFQAALAHTTDPLPDLFLERATNLEAAGRGALALGAIEEGLRSMPGVVTLQDAALELELELSRFDAALARIDALLAAAPRKETLLARKASVLDRAGKLDLAKRTRQEALLAIARLPASKRELPSTKTLEQELRAALAGAGAPAASAPRATGAPQAIK